MTNSTNILVIRIHLKTFPSEYSIQIQFDAWSIEMKNLNLCKSIRSKCDEEQVVGA